VNPNNAYEDALTGFIARILDSVDDNPFLDDLEALGATMAWFGALNICRELVRQAGARRCFVWPEDLEAPLLANAQELTVQAMSTAVSLIMAGAAGRSDVEGHAAKMRTSLLGSLAWLETHANDALAQLPSNRDLSYLEVTLFCLVTHLEFRRVAPTESYSALNAFCRDFAERPSARATAFRFDA
jgi:hypothetical protein